MRLATNLIGEIYDVIVHNHIPYLAIDGPVDNFLLPLLCPVCGQAWHFVNVDEKKLEAKLRKMFAGFTLNGIQYIPRTTSSRITLMLKQIYFDSGLMDPVVRETAEHYDDGRVFPVVSLILEKLVPLNFHLDELREMKEEDARQALDLMQDESLADALNRLEEIEATEDDVDDDIMIVIHPAAVLNAVTELHIERATRRELRADLKEESNAIRLTDFQM